MSSTRSVWRKKKVKAETGLSDSTIDRLEKANQFPTRIVLVPGGNSVGWYSDEVKNFIDSRPRGLAPAPEAANSARRNSKSETAPKEANGARRRSGSGVSL